MTNIETVIKALENCINGCYSGCPYEYGGAVTLEYCREDLMRDALELLEEQETIVRCKNCIHWAPCEGSIICGTCKQGHLRSANWFCADGERK